MCKHSQRLRIAVITTRKNRCYTTYIGSTANLKNNCSDVLNVYVITDCSSTETRSQRFRNIIRPNSDSEFIKSSPKTQRNGMVSRKTA